MFSFQGGSETVKVNLNLKNDHRSKSRGNSKQDFWQLVQNSLFRKEKRKINALLFLFLLLAAFPTEAQQLKTFGNIPGRLPSDKYQCRVRPVCSNSWQNAFVLQTISQASNNNAYVSHLTNWSASWIAFEFEGMEVVVEISKVDGTPIQSAMVRPVGMASPAVIENGKVYVTFSSNTNINVDIDGQMEDQYTGMFYSGPPVHTISLFGNPIFQVPDTSNSRVHYVNPGESIPSDVSLWDTIYFAPGIHHIGTPYRIQSNKTLFIPGDAVVHGTIHPPNLWGVNSAHSWSVYGSGTISGEEIPHWSVGTLSGDSSKVFTGPTNNIHLEGFVVADPAHHTFNMITSDFNDTSKANVYKNLKILGWRLNGDGLNAFVNSIVSDCFFRCQDDLFYYGGDHVKISNCVTWADVNGAVLRLHKGSSQAGSSYFKNIRSIYHRNSWHYHGGGGNVISSGFNEGENISNILISNILNEDPHPSLPTYTFLINPDSNAAGPSTFSNVVIEKVIQINPGTPNAWGDANFYTPQNVMLGSDSVDMFSNFLFKNCYYANSWISSFSTGNFLSNNFTNNISFVLDDTSSLYPTVYSGSINGEIANIPASPVITAAGPTTFFTGDSVVLISNIGNDVVWLPNMESDSVITVFTTGSYWVVNTNAIGCTASSNVIDVIVNPITVSVNNALSDSEIYLYPNPGQNYFRIAGKQETIKEIRIFNNHGELLLQEGNQNSIDVSYLPKGIYFIEVISTENKRLAREKFVKHQQEAPTVLIKALNNFPFHSS